MPKSPKKCVQISACVVNTYAMRKLLLCDILSVFRRSVQSPRFSKQICACVPRCEKWILKKIWVQKWLLPQNDKNTDTTFLHSHHRPHHIVTFLQKLPWSVHLYDCYCISCFFFLLFLHILLSFMKTVKIVTIGRFHYTSLTTYTDRSCADVISRCVVFISAACYPHFYTYATCGSPSIPTV